MNNWLIYAIGSAFFAGLTAILGKVGVKDINSNFATFIRTIVIMVVSSLVITMRSEWEGFDKLHSRTLMFLVFSGIATGLSWLCYYKALQLGPVSKVAPIDKLSVVFAIILAVVFLGESLSWQVLTGGLLIVAGSLVIVFAS
ncbi:MAG: EamA family transporter [Bacteriovorax sp.]|nr:EamA family transporter [Bacteriovorax sp.]